jgi:hypothetical protein
MNPSFSFADVKTREIRLPTMRNLTFISIRPASSRHSTTTAMSFSLLMKKENSPYQNFHQ